MSSPRARRLASPLVPALAIFALSLFVAPVSAEPLFRPARYDYYIDARGDFDLGDLDGDGIRDLVIPAGYDHIAVLAGRNDGTFGESVRFEAGLSPNAVVLADLDGSGTLDAAVATHNKLAILLGDGAGEFGPPTFYDPGSSEEDLAVGDFDGNGVPDVVITHDEIAVYLGQGDGSFQEPTHYPAGTHPRSVAVADLDDDSIQDIAVASQIGGVTVFLGNGDGSFRFGVSRPAGTLPRSIKIGDLDGDAHPDLAVANWHGRSVSVLFGTGGGEFTSGQAVAIPDDPLALEIGDLDGDGAQDIVAMVRMSYANSGGIWFLRGDGSGGFAVPSFHPIQSDGRAARFEDVDADGRTDLLVSSGYLSIFHGTGDLDIAAPRYPTAGVPKDVVSGRFDEDSAPDVVVLTDGGVEVLRGQGDGAFVASAFVDGVSDPRELASGDFDGDGILDLVAVEHAQGAGVWLGTAEGTFVPRGSFRTGIDPRAVAVGHLDGDDVLDVATANQYTIGVLLGTGDGDFEAPLQMPGAGAMGLEIGDVDGDGRGDVVTAQGSGTNGRIDVAFGAGDGTFPRSRSFGLPETPYDFGIRDLDRDGDVDIVVALVHDLHVLWGRGDGTFEGETYSAAGNGSWMALSSLAIGDVNGDGAPDVLTVRGFQLERINVFLGPRPHETDRSLRLHDRGYGAGHYPQAMTLADFDGDGDLDIATANAGTGDVAILLGTVGRRPTARAGAPEPARWPDTAPPMGSIGLQGVYPSPFRAATGVAFTLPTGSRALLEVLDVRGGRVRVLLDDALPAGRHTTRWDGRDALGRALPAGVYFVRLETAGRVETRKVVRLR